MSVYLYARTVSPPLLIIFSPTPHLGWHGSSVESMTRLVGFWSVLHVDSSVTVGDDWAFSGRRCKKEIIVTPDYAQPSPINRDLGREDPHEKKPSSRHK